jgi:predicted TIM-barrel fold metal-dependent hydrolase
MLDTIGLSRTVVVQPSVYGTENAVTLDAVEEIGLGRARAIVVVDETSAPAELAAMAALGARGVRFNAVSGNGAPLEQLERLAERIAPLGEWHVQLYAPADAMPELEPVLRRLPVPVVVDHMGGAKAAEGGVGHPGFRSLLRLLEGGRAWVKLCGYRASAAGPPYADVAPMARALLSAAPDRCVWGTDWPHPSLRDPAEVPDDGELLDALGEWAPDEAVRRAVLVDNPARLYGFA